MFKVSGPDLYTDASGYYSFPIGTVTIQETKAPTGYLLNDEIITVHFTLNERGEVRGDLGTWNTENECEDLTVTSDEQPIYGGIKVIKRDAQTGDTPQNALTFEGAEIEIRNANDADVLVDGVTYGPGEVITTLVTDEKGEASTGSDYLPYGKYSLREVKAPLGYEINEEWNPTVEVTQNAVLTEIAVEDTLSLIDISTTAKDDATGDHVGKAGDEAEITDTVAFTGLLDNRSYTFTGTLRYADTGEVVTGKDAKPCIVTKTVTCSADAENVTDEVVPSNGTIDMPAFTLDASDLGGRTLVVTETLTDNAAGLVVAEHYDLSDKGQSISYVKVETQARDDSTGTRTSVVGNTTITDKVTMTGLIVGETYTVNGSLVYTSNCTDATGKTHKKGDVIAEHDPLTVTANAEEMTVEISFTVDSSALAGLSGVVFEDVWHNDIEVAVHHDYEAEPQTPNWPSVKTTAKDKESGTHTGVVGEVATIVDTVALENLTVGDTYYVQGTLKTSDGEDFLIDGQPLVVTGAKFTADSENKEIELEFTFDSSELENQSLVVYEKLFVIGKDGDVEVSRHEDKDDPGQTVDYPNIHTNAADGATGDEVGTVGEMQIIVDTVTYENLRIGEEYTITGNLHYVNDFIDMNEAEHKAGDVLLDEKGEEITASVTFTAQQKNGTVDLVYTVNSQLLRGSAVVVFEDLEQDGVKLYCHNDLTDKDQRIDYPEVKTTALDKDTEEHIGSVEGPVEIVDYVELTGLVKGRIYAVSGILMDKETQEPLVDSTGSEVVSRTEPFKAAGTEMTVELTFVVDDPTLLYGKTTVVFEELLHKNITVSAHADIEDEDQTVHFPEIGTYATSNGEKKSKASNKTIIKDVVNYSNLIAGKTYTVTGVLINKATGLAIVENGKEVTSSVTFAADKESGSIEMTFELNSKALGKEASVVVFEKLYHNGVLVAAHEDIDDEGQTVSFTNIGKITVLGSGSGNRVNTSDPSNVSIQLIMLIAACAALAVIIAKSERKR